jgi:hypothetical protein
VTVGFKSINELTAAGTVQVSHLFPYYATHPVRWICAPLLGAKVVFFNVKLRGEKDYSPKKREGRI